MPNIQEEWDTQQIPELIGKSSPAYAEAVIQEFLYITLFRMCTDSLAIEHETRLASMQEAEKNIEELLDEMQQEYNRERQDLIDRELFDIISGFRALQKED